MHALRLPRKSCFRISRVWPSTVGEVSEFSVLEASWGELCQAVDHTAVRYSLSFDSVFPRISHHGSARGPGKAPSRA